MEISPFPLFLSFSFFAEKSSKVHQVRSWDFSAWFPGNVVNDGWLPGLIQNEQICWSPQSLGLKRLAAIQNSWDAESVCGGQGLEFRVLHEKRWQAVPDLRHQKLFREKSTPKQGKRWNYSSAMTATPIANTIVLLSTKLPSQVTNKRFQNRGQKPREQVLEMKLNLPAPENHPWRKPCHIWIPNTT